MQIENMTEENVKSVVELLEEQKEGNPALEYKVYEMGKRNKRKASKKMSNTEKRA